MDDDILTNIDEIARAKEEHRRRAAALSVPEKIRVVVEMQKRRAPILALRGKVQRVWQVKFAGDDSRSSGREREV